MARVSIIFGLLLCGLSAIAMVSTPLKMPALFIPMMFGIPVLFCGVVGLNPHRRRNSVASAAAIMLFAVVAALARCGYGIALSKHLVDPPVGDLVVPDLTGETVDAYAAKLAFATLVISATFVVIYVIEWLRSKRRSRSDELSSPIDAKSELSSAFVDRSTKAAKQISAHSPDPLNAVPTNKAMPEDLPSCESPPVREFMSSPDP
jgi:hypothetical protein